MKLVVKSPVWDDLRRIGLRIRKMIPKRPCDSSTPHELHSKRRTNYIQVGGSPPRHGSIAQLSQPGIRSVTIRRFRKYIVFYLPISTEVQILAVLHGARDLEPLIEERL